MVTLGIAGSSPVQCGCELMDPAGTIWDQCAKYRDALNEIASVRNEFKGPSLDYMQGYRDGQEFMAKIARDAVGQPSGITG